MDRLEIPSYEVSLDPCDPLASILEWCNHNRGETRAARVLRRRCRSEDIERAPYDIHYRSEQNTAYRPNPRVPTKSYFTLNNSLAVQSLYQCEPEVQNGDYFMAPANNRTSSNRLKSPSRSVKGKPEANSPKSTPSPKIVSSPKPSHSPKQSHSPKSVSPKRSKDDRHRLPKVEELFERTDHYHALEHPKQPLKSILNNPPVNKAMPPGILKKPKNKEIKVGEGRRRQRASSDSDNGYCNYHLATPVPGFDSRLNYLTNTKRAKDNSGTVYSFCSVVPPPPTKNNSQLKGLLKETPVEHRDIRPTGIYTPLPDESSHEAPHRDIEREPPHAPVICPKVSLAVSKKPAPVKSKASKSKLAKSKRTSHHRLALDDDDSRITSMSPTSDLDPWDLMDAETLMQEIEKIESKPVLPEKNRQPSPGPAPAPGPAPTPTPEPSKSSIKKDINGLKKNIIRDDKLNIPDTVREVIRPSLFPRVPPYLKFVGHDDAALKMPLSVQKHLKWKMTTITPIVVKKTLTNSGFRLVKSECETSECPQEETIDWIGIWGKHMKSIMFRAIKDGQKMNHFPGTFQIGRKDRLWRNIQKLVTRHGAKEFAIMPKTYVLPHDMKLLKHEWDKYAADNEKWIIKPPASARGTGIKVVSRWSQIPKKHPVVVQRYVSKPYLINGNKFDLRLYVLVTSIHPLRIYLYKDGLARFASVKYNDEISSLNDRYMHLTNYSINRLSKNYTPNEDFAACEGHKWTLNTLFQYLKKEKKVNTDKLWDNLRDLVVKTIISGEASISSLTKTNVTSRYNCYELFGIDVLLDEDLKPWLLEVNISPSLHSASPLDIHVKGPLVTTVLNIAQFQIPNKINLESLTKDKPHKLNGLPYDGRMFTVWLSKEERDKHIIYTNMEDREMYLTDILSTLTPDDVRHLIQAEDELTQTGDMERIFPTEHTHKYLPYLNGARYYNRLFDAWETRYHRERESGHTLLRNLCEIGYHLEVPPVPLKNDIDAPTPSISERPSVISIEMVAATTELSPICEHPPSSFLPTFEQQRA